MKRPRLFLPALLALFVISFCAIPGTAKDTWLQVRSKNFYLVGNASEKDIRKVGAKLEEFRETLRLLFNRANFTATMPTNVIVFKSDAAFKPFKPRRADGKADNFIAGYFQPGEDANYIVVSAEGDDAEMYRTIFHEYTHFVVNANFGKSEVPPWFNEGLAEYYSTFKVVDGQKVNIGLFIDNHVYELQNSKFIPLEQLFRISNRQLTVQGDHGRGIFYAESWALIHYLIQGGKSDGLGKFLSDVLKGTPQDKAFQDAFQMNYDQMESELRKYVGKSTYQYMVVTFKEPLNVEAEMQTAPYSEAEADTTLGDLLFHIHRVDDAEPWLTAALKLDPAMSMANTTLGMVKLEQRKFDEAKQFLEKATAGDQKNPIAFYRYAYLLSREGQDEFGYVRQFSKDTADKMRQALKQAIALAPGFTESYELLAFVDVVNDEQLDDAVTMMQRALKLQPGNERYAMRLAELYMHQDKFDEAAALARKFAQSDNDGVRQRAEHLTSEIAARQKYVQQMADYKKRAAAGNGTGGETSGPMLRRRESQPQVDEATLTKLNEEATLRFINDNLREPGDGEKRAVGYIEKIECKGPAVTYAIKTDSGPLVLSGKDFQGLAVNTFTPAADNLSIGCGANLADLYAVLTFKDRPSGASKGDLVSLEFVPKTFRLMTKEELEKAESELPTTAPPPSRRSATVVQTNARLSPPNQNIPTPQDIDAQRREMIMQHIRGSIRQPADGEKREIGFLQKIECTNKGMFYNMKTATSILRLQDAKPGSLKITVYAQDLNGVQYGCNTSILDYPVVFIYIDTPNAKLKTAGEIVSLDFVPKTFTLN
ncbi:MAG TPA: tetratricopeptide repeat protein [Pyrinomonadaceae bacterium]